MIVSVIFSNNSFSAIVPYPIITIYSDQLEEDGFGMN
jgi:hypothetical protein